MSSAVRVSSGTSLGSMTPMDWECGYDVSSTQGTSNSLYFRLEAHLATHYRFQKFKNSVAYIDWTENTPVGTVVGPIAFSNGDSVRTLVECFNPCSEENPCPEGFKCVYGECEPCDEQQATHFQFRFEFEELVTTSDASQVMYTLSGIYPISTSTGQIIQGQEVGGVWYYPRIRFCNATGEPKPYTGALSFYGFCNPDGTSALYSNNFGDVQSVSWLIGQKAMMDTIASNPWAVPRIFVEFIEPSEVIYESDCSGVAGDNFPPIEPVPPTEPDEPDEPEEPLPPDDIEEPLPPQPPTEPQEGLCDCEKYLGQQIQRAADILYDGLILLKRELAVIGRELVVELYEKRKIDYQLAMFLQNQQRQILEAQHQRLYEIKQELVDIKTAVEKGLVKDDTGLIDAFIDETGKTINSAVQDIEPVWIENEFNVKSHIVPQGDTPIE